MKNFLLTFLIIFTFDINSEVKILDRVAIIVDDGVVMESQIQNTLNSVLESYESDGINTPPLDILFQENLL